MGGNAKRAFRAAGGRAAALLLALTAVVLGCAGLSGWNGELDVTLAPAALPSSGPRVEIENVVDRRRFRASAPGPWEPTMVGGDVSPDGQIDPNQTVRVVGRQLDGRPGNRGGNVTLSGGETVATLVRDVLLDGFRRSGYRAVDTRAAAGGVSAAGGAARTTATVRAEVLDFWLRVEPSAGMFRHEARLRARVETVGDGSATAAIVCGRSLVSSGGRARVVREKALREGLAALVSDLTSKLPDGKASDPAAPLISGSSSATCFANMGNP